MILGKGLIPNRDELLAEVTAEIGDQTEAEWMVDRVLLPAIHEMVRKALERDNILASMPVEGHC